MRIRPFFLLAKKRPNTRRQGRDVIRQKPIIGAGEHGLFQPGRIGGVPDQGMAAKSHAMVFGERQQGIDAGKIVSARPRLNHMPFHFIFGHQHGGFMRQQRREIGVAKFVGRGCGAEDEIAGPRDGAKARTFARSKA